MSDARIEAAADRPRVRLLPGRHKRIKAGHPWIFSNEVADRDMAMTIAPGAAVTIVGDNGVCYGTAMFNPHSLVAGRLVAGDPDVSLDSEIDSTFLFLSISRSTSSG